MISCVLIALDQITKWLAVHNLKGHDPFILIDGVFEFYYLENPWAAFSLGKQLSSLFLIIVLILTVVFCAFLIWLAFRIPVERRFNLLRIVLILVISGAIGNFIDRVLHHYVIDFFYFVLIDFPIFNVADIYVVIGAVLFIITILFQGSIYEELFPSKEKEPLNDENTGDKEA